MSIDGRTIVLVHTADKAGLGAIIRDLEEHGFADLRADAARNGAMPVVPAVSRGREDPERGSVDARGDDSVGSDALAVQYARWSRAVLLNGLSRYEEALVAAQQVLDDGPELFLAPWVLPELIEAATRSGREDLARDALERLAAVADAAGTDWALALASRSRALLTPGESAEKLYEEAIDRLARTSLRPELARARLLYGEWLRREGRRTEAREQLRAAHDLLVTVGMQAFAERAHHELLATAEYQRSRGVEALTQLTPQEQEIARLAGEGLTNSEIGRRLFLSPRTVEWHLSNIFGKLGLSSRRELRRILPPPGRMV